MIKRKLSNDNGPHPKMFKKEFSLEKLENFFFRERLLKSKYIPKTLKNCSDVFLVEAIDFKDNFFLIDVVIMIDQNVENFVINGIYKGDENNILSSKLIRMNYHLLFKEENKWTIDT